MKTKLAALTLPLALLAMPGQAKAQAGQSKSGTDETGAVTTIKPQEGDLSIADVLRRKASGLEVSTDRNGNIGIRIRNAGTIMTSSTPLILIDGVRASSDELRSLNPLSIDKVRVLRDVSSTSMYGMEGANGVVLIQLKK